MENLIEPNIHPLLVHFTIALTVMAAASYVLARLPFMSRWQASLTPAADWMLAFAAISVIATVAAGFQAYYSVAHDNPSHAVMTTHRNWAAPTALVILVLAFWRWRGRKAAPSLVFTALSVVAAVLLTVTAWWGGRLVFGHGVGVARLPEVSDESQPHEHVAANAPARAAPAAASSAPAPDTPEGVVEAFGAALRAGDEAALRRLMAPDVVIAESGGVESSFDEYAGNHMPADMAFSAAVQFTLEDRDLIAEGDTATIISRSRAEGQFQNRAIHSRMMETMVLHMIDGQWRIVHIHWSSAPITGEHEH
jgi:uncharacterized membrane protein/ketosteroid isomerase-like protein